MQPAGFGYVPAPYSPSTPSSSARFGHPDVNFPGGIGDLDYGRIPVSGGGRRRKAKSHKAKSRKAKSHKAKSRKAQRKH
jgi:hypothetical protein